MPPPQPPPALTPDQAAAWQQALHAIQNAGDMPTVTQALTTYTTALLASTPPPRRPIQGASPMQGDVNAYGARWCAEHGRWECAHQRNRGRGQCHGTAVEGLSGCRMHPGSNGKVKHLAAVAARQGAAVAGRPARVVPKDVHPADALLGEVRYQAGLCAWLDAMVEELGDGELTWGRSEERATVGGESPGTTTVSRAGLNTWVEWAERAHRQLAQVSKWALEADVDERLTRMAEAQGARVVRAFHEGLTLLGLNATQWAKVPEVIPQVLRQLTGAA